MYMKYAAHNVNSSQMLYYAFSISYHIYIYTQYTYAYLKESSHQYLRITSIHHVFGLDRVLVPGFHQVCGSKGGALAKRLKVVLSTAFDVLEISWKIECNNWNSGVWKCVVTFCQLVFHTDSINSQKHTLSDHKEQRVGRTKKGLAAILAIGTSVWISSNWEETDERFLLVLKLRIKKRSKMNRGP